MPGSVVKGDAKKLGAALGLGPESVDCFVTSPPYWDLKNYSAGSEREIGHGQSLAEYSADMGVVFAECARLAKESAALWLVVDTMRNAKAKGGNGEVLPLPFILADIATEHGWRLQDVVVWRKNKTLPFSGHGQLRNLMEYVLLLVRSDNFKFRPHRISERHLPDAQWLFGWPERYHPLGRNPSNIWDISIPNQGVWGKRGQHLHFCPFPQELVERCLALTTDPGDTVVDPFAGTGTVPAQAAVMDRQGFGVELNRSFVELFGSQTLPDFRETWEERSFERELFMDDQLGEAQTIMTLRALKAGKEVSKALAECALKGELGSAAAGVTSIAVVAPSNLGLSINQDTGQVRTEPIEIVVLYDDEIHGDDQTKLTHLLEDILSRPPLSKIGIQCSVRVVAQSSLGETPALAYRDEGLPNDLLTYEFTKEGANTEPLTPALFRSLPRLLTTLRLERPLARASVTLVADARDRAERALYENLIQEVEDLTEVARYVGLPAEHVSKRLDELGIKPKRRAFSV